MQCVAFVTSNFLEKYEFNLFSDQIYFFKIGKLEFLFSDTVFVLVSFAHLQTPKHKRDSLNFWVFLKTGSVGDSIPENVKTESF